MSAQPLRPIKEFDILRLWRFGYDTDAIAMALGVSQSTIANTLARIFDRAARS